MLMGQLCRREPERIGEKEISPRIYDNMMNVISSYNQNRLKKLNIKNFVGLAYILDCVF